MKKKIEVYLAKSNRANPTTVSRVRLFLNNFDYVYRVAEFSGGTYSNKDLIKSDFVFFVLENETCVIGKGLYSQIEDCKRYKIPYVILYTYKGGVQYEVIDKYVLGHNAVLDVIDTKDYVNYATVKCRDIVGEEDLDYTLQTHLNDIIHLLIPEFEKERNTKQIAQEIVKYEKDRETVSKDEDNFLVLLC